MTPYLQAYATYISNNADRELTWTESLDLHFQRGAVISTPSAFVIARPVDSAWPDELHPDPFHIASRSSPTWHVWAAAGKLSALLAIAHAHGVREVTYQRRDNLRLRRLSLPPVQSSAPRPPFILPE